MDRYLFDKRVLKKTLLKYGIMFLIALPFLLAFNILCPNLKFWLTILVDCGILAVVVLVGEIILTSIRNKKRAREEAEAEEKRQLLKERHKAEKEAKKKKLNKQNIDNKNETTEK